MSISISRKVLTFLLQPIFFKGPVYLPASLYRIFTSLPHHFLYKVKAIPHNSKWYIAEEIFSSEGIKAAQANWRLSSRLCAL